MLTALYFDLLTSAVFFPVTASFKSTHFCPIIPDKANYLRMRVFKSFFSLLHAMSFTISLSKHIPLRSPLGNYCLVLAF